MKTGISLAKIDLSCQIYVLKLIYHFFKTDEMWLKTT